MTDERIETWARLFETTQSVEESKQLWDLARASRELGVALAGLIRSTYPEGERP